jgi:hypothetical protein
MSVDFQDYTPLYPKKIELFTLNVDRKTRILAEREAVVGLSVDWKQ